MATFELSKEQWDGDQIALTAQVQRCLADELAFEC